MKHVGRRTDPLDVVSRNQLIFREQLTAPRTYYVRTDGSDSNTGLNNTSGGAFLTTQKAIDVVSALDNGGHDITILHSSGARTSGAVARTFVGSGKIILMGDVTTPANCIWSASGAVFFVPDGTIGRYEVLGFRMSSPVNVCLQVGRGSVLDYGAIEFADSFGHVAVYGGTCTAISGYRIVANPTFHASVTYGGFLSLSGVSVSLSSGQAFGFCFVRAEIASIISADSVTFSGSATGVRYIVTDNSVIFVNGAGATYLPGNAAGTNDGTGVYR